MMRGYEIENVLNDGNDDERVVIYAKGRNPRTPPFLLITKNFCTE